VKSCCRDGLAGRMRSSVFFRLSCRWCSFIHAEMSTRQLEICAGTVGSSGWEVELGVISIARETMCLYDGSQWCGVNGEEEGSNHWALGNPCGQFMCFGYLTSPCDPEGPTCEIGLKPVEGSSRDAQWWEGGQKDLMVHSFEGNWQV